MEDLLKMYKNNKWKILDICKIIKGNLIKISKAKS